jgi:WD40 repeat protein
LATVGGGEGILWDLSATNSATLESGLTETVPVTELLSLPGDTSLALSPDGKTLVAGFEDGSFRSYMLDLEELLALARSRLTRIWTAEECRQFRIEPCPAES